MRTVNSFVGQAIERLEDLRLVRGRGQFVDDLARNDMLHAARGVQHVVTREIVDELATAANQAQVFQPFDRLTDERIDGPHAAFSSRLYAARASSTASTIEM